MQILCMRHRITTEGSTNKGAKELKHSSKNLQQQWPRGVFTLQSTVAHKSLAAGQPVATSKRRCANLFKRHRIQPDTKYAKPATGISNTTRSLQTTAFWNLTLPNKRYDWFSLNNQLLAQTSFHHKIPKIRRLPELFQMLFQTRNCKPNRDLNHHKSLKSD
ncbi:binding [Dorcoceras hygrometricum]|uniref:Binding n=1 Tax=Dorcoceras hygrometricum TaxID=472368 RepID=A0A2Z7BMR8_9LAMI|nr:binding [Dorcoceras hygrometricum]